MVDYKDTKQNHLRRLFSSMVTQTNIMRFFNDNFEAAILYSTKNESS